jgi:DNA-binding transcriptional LysR family regulator
MHSSDRVSRRLKPRDLQVFIRVAEDGNMTKAAKHLAISRPAVSKTIADLEHTLGVRLLDRTSEGSVLTLYGRALLKRSFAVLDELRQSVKEIEFLADPSAGELRIGFGEVPAAGLIPAAIAQFSRQYSRMVVHTEQGSFETLLEFLRTRKCEVVVTRWRAQEPDVRVEPLHYDRLSVVVGAHSRWAKRRRVGLSDLADEPWIQSPAEMSPGSPTLEAFRALGLPSPRCVVFSSSLNLRYGLLATGRFVTMIPDSALYYAPRTPIRVLPIKLPQWHVPICIVTLKDRTLSPLAQLFIDRLHKLARSLVKV